MKEQAVRITEIFYSLQGEAKTVGLPTVFVRLTGCPLRCHYCDTEYAFHGGESFTVEQVLAQVAEYGAKFITVTGGEPLAQQSCLPLLSGLCNQTSEGGEVSLETSGALPIGAVDERVAIVMDIKTPASGELDRNLWENLELLKNKDQVKFVICDREDYEWSKEIIEKYQLNEKVGEVLLSPCEGKISPRELAEWILLDRLDVRFQLQLHKLLWSDAQGR